MTTETKVKKEKSIKQKIVELSNELRIDKDGKNSFANYSYFRPDDVLKAITPLLEKYGLIAMFNMTFNHEKQMYESSLTIEHFDTPDKVEYKFDIPLTSVKGASAAQGAGATQTYAKRYLFMNVFNIADNNDDLDSKPTNEEKPATRAIKGLKSDLKSTSEDICPKCGIGTLKEKDGVKNGKHWQGQFCQNPNCKHVIWGPKLQDIENKEKGVNGLLDNIKEEEENDPRNYQE